MVTQQQSQELFTGSPLVPAEQRDMIIAMSYSLASGNNLNTSIALVESRQPMAIDQATYLVGNDMVDNLNDILVSVQARVPDTEDPAEYSITPAMSTAVAIMHATTGIVLQQEVQRNKNMALTYGRLLIMSVISNIAMVVTAWLT